MSDPVNLERLMCRYQAGEIDAFDELYAALSPPLLQYLTSLSRDRTLAGDLLQDAFALSLAALREAVPGMTLSKRLVGSAIGVSLMMLLR